MKSTIIVTITDNISASSMPFNEFVLYRLKNSPEEKQIVILLFKDKVSVDVVIPPELEFYIVGDNSKELRQIASEIDRKGKVNNCKVVFHIHEAKSVLFFNVATHFRYSKQILYTLHSTYKNYPLHNKIFSRIASFQCAYVVCVSKTSLKHYPYDIRFLRKSKVKYIQNGVDIDRISIAKSEKHSSGFLNCVYVARMRPSKRHELLIEAIRSVDGINLIFVGTGVLEEQLKDKAKKFRVDNRIMFCGQLPRDQVYERIKSSDVFLSASTYEGLPIGVLEGMACGLPCILSNIEQHREIEECCSHIILTENDLDSWIVALADIKEKSKDELQTIGLLNKNDVESAFSLKRMHDEYNYLYEKIRS